MDPPTKYVYVQLWSNSYGKTMLAPMGVDSVAPDRSKWGSSIPAGG